MHINAFLYVLANIEVPMVNVYAELFIKRLYNFLDTFSI